MIASGGLAVSVCTLEFLSFQIKYTQAWYINLTINFTFLSLVGAFSHLNLSSNTRSELRWSLVVKNDHTLSLNSQSKNKCCLHSLWPTHSTQDGGTINPHRRSLSLVTILSLAATQDKKACLGILPENHTTSCQSTSNVHGNRALHVSLVLFQPVVVVGSWF